MGGFSQSPSAACFGLEMSECEILEKKKHACSRKSRRLSPRPAPRALGWMQNAVSSTQRLSSSVRPMSRTTAQPNTCSATTSYLARMYGYILYATAPQQLVGG